MSVEGMRRELSEVFQLRYKGGLKELKRRFAAGDVGHDEVEEGLSKLFWPGSILEFLLLVLI